MGSSLSIIVVGAGLIGRRHIAALLKTKGAELGGIVDPFKGAKKLASTLNVPWFSRLGDALRSANPDGAIIATPNQLHTKHGLQCLKAGVPILMEKPISSDVKSAKKLVAAGRKLKVAILVGHHRRHNSLIKQAKKIIKAGKIGEIVSVHGACWLFKPDDYFEMDWRTRPGAGPVLINLIHDIDLMRHLCGEIVHVHAMQSHKIRQHQVEESAVILLRFKNGALGTLSVSDCIVSPWSWELTAQENPSFPSTAQACYKIGGTHGALELPQNRLWQHKGKRSWLEPLNHVEQEIDAADPLDRQLAHFCNVIRGATPLVDGEEGLKTLQVVEAIKHSAAHEGVGTDIRYGPNR